MIKKTILLICVCAIAIPFFNEAHAVRINETYKFGSKKGEIIGTAQQTQEANQKTQEKLLGEMVVEQKKTNDLLQQQINLLSQQKKEGQDLTIDLIRELAKAIKEQNKILKKILEKK